jgi:hypothetical protein
VVKQLVEALHSYVVVRQLVEALHSYVVVKQLVEALQYKPADRGFDS